MAENNRGSEIKNKIAKGAATVAGGPAAGKAVDLANKSKLGHSFNRNADLLSKQKPNPSSAPTPQSSGKSLDDLPKEGLKDKERSSSSSSTLGKLKNKLGGLGGSKSSSTLDSDGETEDSYSNYGDKLFDLLKNHKKAIFSVAGGAIIALVMFVSVYFAIASASGTVIEFFTKIGDSIVGFFNDDEFDAQEAIEDYYKELENVKSKAYAKKGVCVDENLITATLTVDLDAFHYTEQGEEDAKAEVYAMADDMVSQEKDEYSLTVEQYKEMKRQVRVLANMQIVTKKYGNDKTLDYAGGKCKPEGSGTETPLVIEDNYLNFDTTLFRWLGLFFNGVVQKEELISDDPNLVSMHDKGALFKFFSRKVNEERNYEYHLYQPEAEMQCVGQRRANGDCAGALQPVCNDKLPEDGYELSIGDLQTMEQSVYYWNLINQFIPEYYADYLPPEDHPEYEDAVKNIAERIYLLYEDLGPGESCLAGQTYICRSDEGSDYYSAVSNNGGITRASRSDFMDSISSVAIDEMTRSGILSSITMAQAALESAWGGSGLSTRYSNYYGITAGSCASGLGSPADHKGEVYASGQGENDCTGNNFWNGSVVAACNSSGADCQWYRIYDSFENSTRDHSRLLSSSRYADCNNYGDPVDQITCIKNAGYATDPNYIQKVMGIINTYDLTQFDIGDWQGTYLDFSDTLYGTALCYEPGFGYSGGAGDWASWKQTNSAWSDLHIGTKTIGQVGCLMTSVAIQIARSGVATTLGENFNPGTFMEAHKANGGFSGNSFYWDVSAIAPDFKYKGSVPANNGNAAGVVSGYLNQGYYVILNLHHPGEHHVAVDRVENGRIYMYDPGNYGDEVFSAFNSLSIDSIGLYKVGG